MKRTSTEPQQRMDRTYTEGVLSGLQISINRTKLVIKNLERDYGPGYRQGASVVLDVLEEMRKEILK